MGLFGSGLVWFGLIWFGLNGVWLCPFVFGWVFLGLAGSGRVWVGVVGSCPGQDVVRAAAGIKLRYSDINKDNAEELINPGRVTMLRVLLGNCVKGREEGRGGRKGKEMEGKGKNGTLGRYL